MNVSNCRLRFEVVFGKRKAFNSPLRIHRRTESTLTRLLLKEAANSSTASLVEVRGTRAILQRARMEFDPHKQFLTQKEFFHNSSTSLFGLSEYGAKYAKEILGCQNALAFEVKDTEHEFLITLFHIRLREFCRAHNLRLDWEQNPINHKHLINTKLVLPTPDLAEFPRQRSICT